MDFYYEQGKKFLNAVKLPKERKEALAEYAARMMKRQKIVSFIFNKKTLLCRTDVYPKLMLPD